MPHAAKLGNLLPLADMHVNIPSGFKFTTGQFWSCVSRSHEEREAGGDLLTGDSIFFYSAQKFC